VKFQNKYQQSGYEASGTGNMKFALNGAVTIGTPDGANEEILEEVGAENFFSFGLTTEQVREVKAQGYQPMDIYRSDDTLKEAIDQIQSGFFSENGNKELFRPLVDSLLYKDTYLVLKDFSSYIELPTKGRPYISRPKIDGPKCLFSIRHGWANFHPTAPLGILQGYLESHPIKVKIRDQ
jgi:glucan phosphorylase